MSPAPHIVGPVYSLPPLGCEQWEVCLGLLRLTINANSHQSAKKAAIDYWASCNACPDIFRKSIELRIAEKWRGGIKARRIVKRSEAP